MTIPYPMPDPVTEDADGNIVPVRNLIPRRGRQYPDGPLEAPPGSISGRLPADPAWIEAAGEFMHRMLNPEPEPEPPYVHTLVSPEPIGWDENGNAMWPTLEEPPHTLTAD